MRITPKKITVSELLDGYEENPDDRVVGWGGKLDIRPSYQREYIHDKNPDFQENLIKSVYHQLPINLVYFAKMGENAYELLDGQQRILTICRYVYGVRDFPVELNEKPCYFNQLEADGSARQILDYEVHVHICEGDRKELMEWFRTINTGAHKLSEQELRNSFYNGPWVTDAKRYFTKPGGQAIVCGRYMTGKRERQDHLEQIIQWRIGSKKDEDICAFMGKHQQNPDAKELWKYFEEIDAWILGLFDEDRSLRGIDWGKLHRKYSEHNYDPKYTKGRAKELLDDYEVKAKSGIYEYILSGEIEEKHLNLRTFDKAVKKKIWIKQGRICPPCKKTVSLRDAHADHIKPWSKGGKTEEENCQVLCVQCNLSKSNKQ